MATTPMFAPDGTLGDIPQERVAEATAAGFKPGQELVSPKGEAGVVPLDRVLDAYRAGFIPKQNMASMPGAKVNVQPGPEGLEADPNTPHNPYAGAPGASAINRPVTGKDLIPGGTVGGLAALAAAPAVTGLSAGAVLSGLKQTASAGLKAAPYVAASEAINYARQNLPGGKFIPPGAEMIPLFMSGNKAEVSPKIEGRPEGLSVEELESKYQVQNLPVQGVKSPQGQGQPNLPEMQPAQSTTVSQHGYDPAKQQMFVQFKNGNVYRYSGVPQKVYDQYNASESQGSFHAQQIKGRYQTDLVGKVKPTPGQKVSQALGGQ